MHITDWRKSSRSDTGDDVDWCIEAGRVDTGEVAVRDTKQLGQGPILTFSRDGWASLLDTLKSSK